MTSRRRLPPRENGRFTKRDAQASVTTTKTILASLALVKPNAFNQESFVAGTLTRFQMRISQIDKDANDGIVLLYGIVGHKDLTAGDLPDLGGATDYDELAPYLFVATQYIPASGSRWGGNGGDVFDIDTKAMRKMGEDDRIHIVTECSTTNATIQEIVYKYWWKEAR